MQEKLHMNQHPGTDPPPFTTRIVGKNGNSLLLRKLTAIQGGGQPGILGDYINRRRIMQHERGIAGRNDPASR